MSLEGTSQVGLGKGGMLHALHSVSIVDENFIQSCYAFSLDLEH